MEPQGFVFAFDITSDSLVLNVNPSSKSLSNGNPCSKTSPRSKSLSLALGSNRRSIKDQPCPRGSGRFNGVSFWKSLQRNVKKHMGCFKVVCDFPKPEGPVDNPPTHGIPGYRISRYHHIACHSPGSIHAYIFEKNIQIYQNNS